MPNPDEIRLNLKPSTISLLKTCGVPTGLLRGASINLRERVATYQVARGENQAPKEVSQAEQIATLRKLSASNYDKPFLIVFNGQHDFMLARQAAVLFFAKAVQKARSNAVGYMGAMPRWHYLTAGFDNPVLRDYTSGTMAMPTLLVIDGLATDMSNTKQERLHELVHLLCDRPRLLLISGDNAPELMRSLAIKYTTLIKFAPNRRSISI